MAAALPGARGCLPPGTTPVRGSENPTRAERCPRHAEPYMRMFSMMLAVCPRAMSVLRAWVPASSPPSSVTRGQAAPNRTASDLTLPNTNGRQQKKEGTLSDFTG